MATSEFQYKPLRNPSNTIRLLKVTKGRRFTNNVQCVLRDVELEKAGRFTALSYTWGKPTKTHTIRLANFNHEGEGSNHPRKSSGFRGLFRTPKPTYYNFGVTQNLFEMLHHLHHMAAKMPEGRVEWFWIDAICINQQDLFERASQVPVMGKIYSSACWVAVWLGGFDCGCKARDQNCSCLSRRELETAFKWSYFINDACRRLNVHEMDLPETPEFLPSEHVSRSLTRLFSRRWFSRMWIFQEVTLPLDHRRVIAFCGTEGISFSCLLQVSQYFRKLDHDHELLSDHEVLARMKSVFQVSSLCSSRDNMTKMRAVTLAIGERFAFTLMSTSGMFDCTDDRDRLYGLYGFIENIHTIPSLKPDYTKPVDEIYLEAARFIVESTGTLMLLSAAPNRSGGPSWVPTWKRPVFPLLTEFGDHSELYARYRSHTHFQFSACGRRLTARVASLGDIAHTIPIVHPSRIYDVPSLAEFVRSTMNSLSTLNWWQNKYARREEMEIGLATATLRMLCGAHNFDDDAVFSYKTYTGRSSWLDTSDRPGPDLVAQVAKATHQFTTFRFPTRPREFFVFMTTKGYIAVARDIFPGDCRLYVVPGCYEPVVFVPQNDDWRIHEYSEETFIIHGVNSDTWGRRLDAHLEFLARNTAWEDITIC